MRWLKRAVRWLEGASVRIPLRYRGPTLALLPLVAIFLWLLLGSLEDSTQVRLLILFVGAILGCVSIALAWVNWSGEVEAWARLGLMYGILWALLVVGTLVTLWTGTEDELVAAAGWLDDRLATVSDTVKRMEQAILTVAGAVGSASLVALAVLIPFGSRDQPGNRVLQIERAVSRLVSIVGVAALVFFFLLLALLGGDHVWRGALGGLALLVSVGLPFGMLLVGQVLWEMWQAYAADHLPLEEEMS